MSNITYEIYSRPSVPHLDPNILPLINEHDPNVYRDYDSKSETAEQFLLRTVDVEDSWPQPFRDWYQDIISWIPGDALEWSMNQQSSDDEPELAPMPPEWWMTQATDAIIAREAGEPVGTFWLTEVRWRDRPILGPEPSWHADPLFYEARALVVEKRLRRTGAKIGTILVQELVDVARRRQVAMVAITTNPHAARLFAANGAKETLPTSEFPCEPHTKKLACWDFPNKVQCASCPKRDGQLWLWPVTSTEEAIAA